MPDTLSNTMVSKNAVATTTVNKTNVRSRGCEPAKRST